MRPFCGATLVDSAKCGADNALIATQVLRLRGDFALKAIHAMRPTWF